MGLELVESQINICKNQLTDTFKNQDFQSEYICQRWENKQITKNKQTNKQAANNYKISKIKQQQ